MPRGKKVAGRVLGTPNKRTKEFLELVNELIEIRGYKDPREALLELTQHDDAAIKLQAIKVLLPYLYPQRKAIQLDVSTVAEKAKAATREEQLQMLKDKINRIEGSL